MLTHVRRASVATIALVAAAALVACGSDDDGDSADTTAAAATDTTAAVAPSTAAPDTTAATETTGGHTATTMAGMMMVEVGAVDYAFEDLPESVEAGTMLGLTNESTAEVHELVAFRLADDETRPVEELVQLPQAELEALFAVEPATVVIAPPGEAGIPVVGDGSLTEPGRYAIMCFIPIGADPAEYLAAAQASTEGPPQVAGGPPHFTAGMWAELTVE